MNNFQRFVRNSLILDEETGEFINIETGEVLDSSEISEMLQDVNPAARPDGNKSFESLLMAAFELNLQIAEAFRDNRVIFDPLYPEMIIGETNLSEGAGTENKIYKIGKEATTFQSAVLKRLYRSLAEMSLNILRRIASGSSLNMKFFEELDSLVQGWNTRILAPGGASSMYGERFHEMYEQQIFFDLHEKELKETKAEYLMIIQGLYAQVSWDKVELAIQKRTYDKNSAHWRSLLTAMLQSLYYYDRPHYNTIVSKVFPHFTTEDIKFLFDPTI